MKKLITVLSITLLGLSVSAASVDWSVDFFDVAASADTTAFTLYVFSDGDSASTLASALNSGGTFNETAYNNALSSASKVTGSFDADGWAQGTALGVDNYISVLVLSNGTTAESVFYYTGSIDASAYTYTPPAGNPGSLYLDTSEFTSGTVGTAGSSGDIPEPTSGMLLLIGGSLLALRRKRK